MQIKYIERFPTSEEYNMLTEAVGWGTRENSIIEEALRNTLYSLCVYDMDKIIGYGRIIGDKTIFLYIHSVMIIPEYQGKQIGTGIMNNLLKQIDEYKKVNPNIRTYLGASKGKEAFYEKFGFVARPNEELGAGMILYNKEKEC
ncbi:MAG: GNAT family N-acetyltransferase [Clostridia bacterium]|nr:GNAT family N-acetyltransferase [Clostridia bacterium]